MKKVSLLLISMLFFIACSKDAEPETKIDLQSLNLKYDQEHHFAVLKGSENLSGLYNWASSDPTVGTVTADGKFTARKIGSTVVSAKTNGQEFLSYITVSPYSTMFREPQFEFGQDKATIKNNYIGLVDAETENLLVYSIFSNTAKRIIFVFEYDNLAGIAVDFDDTDDVIKEAKTFFQERYPNLLPITDTQDSIYVNDGKNVAVHLTHNESLGFYASYGRVTFTNGRLSADNKSLKSALNKL